MGYIAKVILDSISPLGVRLTTLECTFPRFILAEMNTHRVFSRNSASSRAVPTAKMIKRVEDDPVFPIEWGKNQSGMQARELLDAGAAHNASLAWDGARKAAIKYAKWLAETGAHKQIVNRVLEPYLWHTAIITATEWTNFFDQRLDGNAQPEMQEIARLMYTALYDSDPKPLDYGQWHLPYIQADEWHYMFAIKRELSVARCARVSYLNHDGVRDVNSDLDLYNKLIKGRHLSPFEHAARPVPDKDFHANFRGWVQHRAFVEYLNTSQQLQEEAGLD